MRAGLCVVLVALAACDTPKAKPPKTASSDSTDTPPPPEDPPAPPPPAPVASSAMPPPTPKKAGCLDSTRGAKHTFVGKLEKHPDGSGAVRVRLAKKVCFSGGRFSSGETDEVVLDIDDLKAKPLLTKKVKVVGTSQDYAPAGKYAYVMRLDVVSLAATK